MTPVSVLYVFALSCYLTLGILVLVRSPRSSLNRACALVMLCLAVWSYADIHHNYLHMSEEQVRSFANLGSIGWSAFPAAMLLFVVIMTNHAPARRSVTFRSTLVLLPALFIYQQLAGNIGIGYTKHSFGWLTVWSTSVWPILYYVYYISCTAAVAALLIAFRRHSRNAAHRRSAAIVLVTTLVAVLLATMTNVILPRLVRIPFPELPGIVGLFWAAGIFWATTRHGLLSLTPQTAAEAILATMPGPLFLLSSEGEVVTQNRAAAELLGYRTFEIAGSPLASLSDQPDILRSILGQARVEESSRGQEVSLRAKDGRLVTFEASARLLQEKGAAAGIVMVLSDLTSRKQAESALRDSEARYRAFLQGFQGVAFSAGLDQNPVFVHGTIEELTGYSSREFMSGEVRWKDLIHPGDVERLRTSSLRLRTKPGYSTTREYRIMRKDGTAAWVREAVGNVCDDSGKPVAVNGAMSDVTEHHRAMDELMVLSQFRESVIDSADILMAALDDDGNVIVWNRAAERITGYSRSEVVGERGLFARLFPDPAWRSALQEKAGRAMPQGGILDDVESEIATRNGGRRILALRVQFASSAGGGIGGHIVLGRDVTEQRQAESALRQSEANFQAVAENANEGIVVVSAAGICLYVNRCGARMAGIRAEEVLGTDFSGILRPEDVEWLRQRLTEQLDGKSAPSDFTITRIRKDGTELDLQIVLTKTVWRGEPAMLVFYHPAAAPHSTA